MHFYATLILGSTYIVKGLTFNRGVEQPVSPELAQYLSTVSEDQLITEGSGYAIRKLTRFKIREVEPTDAEKVEAETADTPDTLKLNKPARKV